MLITIIIEGKSYMPGHSNHTDIFKNYTLWIKLF
jgi:hypothetical protein